MLGSIAPFLFASLLSFQGAGPAREKPKPYNVPEAYEVYAMVIPAQWPVSAARPRKLLISAETGSGAEMCLKPEGDSIAIVGPAIANYLEVNQKTWLLEKILQIERPYDLIFPEELERFFYQGAARWRAFYEKYPDSDGWIDVSAVGFNESRTIAIVKLENYCGLACGGGEFHVLEKKEGKWRPLKWKGSSCRWVS